MDRDLTFDLSWVTGTVGLNDYIIYGGHDLDVDDHIRVFMKSGRFDSLFFVHKHTKIVNGTLHLNHLFESSGIFIYFFRFQAFLGAIHSIVNGSLTCADNGAAFVVAYDGPLLDMTKLDSYLVRLQEWPCGYTQAVSEMLQPSIGDLTLLLLVNKTYSSNYSLEFLLLMREIQKRDDVAITKEYMLPSTFNSTWLGRIGTLFYKLYITSMSPAFVSIVFKKLIFEGYTGRGCDYGGLFIFSSHEKYSQATGHIGGICSQKVADQMVDLFGSSGLTLYRHVQIYVKQYQMLSYIAGILVYQTDECLGMVNALALTSWPSEFYFTISEGAIIRQRRYYRKGINYYYRWEGRTLAYKRAPGRCFRLQYTLFNHISIDVGRVVKKEYKLSIAMKPFDNTIQSRFSVRFLFVSDDLQDFDSCLLDTLRFYPDNRNDEPFIHLAYSEEEPWFTTAYSAKVGMDMACLVFAGAYIFSSKDLNNPGECMSDVGGYLYDAEHPIIPKAGCGRVRLGADTRRRISFQRPVIQDRCCKFDGVLYSTRMPCLTTVSLYQTLGLEPPQYNVHKWYMTQNATELLLWQGVCTQMFPYDSGRISYVESCLDMIVVANASCDIILHYRASLDKLHLNPNLTYTQNSIQTCLEGSCYSIPQFTRSLSWVDAQKSCEADNSSLVSVNSDVEWRILMSHGFLAWDNVGICYLGARTEVNISFSTY